MNRRQIMQVVMSLPMMAQSTGVLGLGKRKARRDTESLSLPKVLPTKAVAKRARKLERNRQLVAKGAMKPVRENKT